MNAKTKMLMFAAIMAATLTGVVANAQFASAGVATSTKQSNNAGFTDTFFIENCNWSSTGSNRFFILEPNYQLVLEAIVRGVEQELIRTVTMDTRVVDGVPTRVVEERHYENDEIVEISRNYFAICQETNSVFYFGEEVDNYENGIIINHNGSWIAGENGAKAGVYMPGIVLLGSKYQEETAPGAAMDRGQIISLSEKVNTPAGKFTDVLKIKETTPLEPIVIDYKYWAAGIGLIQDGPQKLEDYGYNIVPLG